ncbi:MAG: alpha-amylase family glycosyl hydrolase [Bacilli bacterium]|nr:alpha-amylase family glycosyl hydrolase [Bacilli bacterium]
MKRSMLALLASSAVLALSGCGTSSSPSSSEAGDTSSSASSSSLPGSSVSDSPPSSSSSSSEGPELPSSWKGCVRIYIHRDDGVYSDYHLWIWGTGVSGYQDDFANIDSPDAYGVYYDIHLSESPWANRSSITSLSFLVKNKDEGVWDYQTTDTTVRFNDFSSNLDTCDDGTTPRITCYGVITKTDEIDTYAKKSDAIGDRIESAVFTDWRTLVVTGTGSSEGRESADVGKIASWELYAYSAEYWNLSEEAKEANKQNYLLQSGTGGSNAITIKFDADIVPSNGYTVEATFASDTSKIKTGYASYIGLYDTPKFASDFTYMGADLGLTWTDEGKEVYKLWAPTASCVWLYRYTSGVPSALATDGESHESWDYHSSSRMSLGEGGVWSTTRAHSSSYSFYAYAVEQEGSIAVTADPYARSSGINGVRSAILTDAQIDATDPEGFRDSVDALAANEPVASPNQLSVYEVHVRDFTSDDSWISHEGNANGTYKAFAESGTACDGVSSGFDSLVDLHPDAVQLLPVFDQDNDERTFETGVGGDKKTVKPNFNWGYNPLNYNVVEGAYSSDPYSPTVKMNELKGLVKALSDKGIRTIMDVVYNHVSSVSSSAFTKIMPKYYFRTDEGGAYSDGSGCGNEIASERPMVRNFIEQSVMWWAKEYGMKGFRFDLMAVIDLATMRQIKRELHEYDPNIVVYGEGWLGGSSSIDPAQASTCGNVYASLSDCGGGPTDCVGTFNDGVRKGLTGDQGEDRAPFYGFMASGADDVAASAEDRFWKTYCGYLGENKSVGVNPYQTVNYASCHDNYTLYDQFNYTIGDGASSTADSDDAKRATVGAETYILLGNGLAFFQGGEEIFRQKIMSSEECDELGAKVGDEVIAIGSTGKYLVRNSYRSSDEVNGFKWDRKAHNIAYFNQLKEAFQLRRDLYGKVVGFDRAAINASVSPWNQGAVSGAIGINIVASGTYYLFLGCRSGATLGIGADPVSTVVSTADRTSPIDVSGGSIAIRPFECLLVRKN